MKMNNATISCILALIAIAIFIITVAFSRDRGAGLDGINDLDWILPLWILMVIIAIVGFVYSITAIVKEKTVLSWICFAVYMLPILAIAITIIYAGISNPTKISSDKKIKKVESFINEKFPNAYKVFLLNKDKKYDERSYYEMSGIINTKEDLLNVQQKAKKILDDWNYSINRPYWVFSNVWYDYFAFFYFDEGENPPVYFFIRDYQNVEGDNRKRVPKVVKATDSLEEYLKQFQKFEIPGDTIANSEDTIKSMQICNIYRYVYRKDFDHFTNIGGKDLFIEFTIDEYDKKNEKRTSVKDYVMQVIPNNDSYKTKLFMNSNTDYIHNVFGEKKEIGWCEDDTLCNLVLNYYLLYQSKIGVKIEY